MDFTHEGEGGALARALIVDDITTTLLNMSNDQAIYNMLFSDESQYDRSAMPKEKYIDPSKRDMFDPVDAFNTFVRSESAE